tara:strand:- start:808 stop:1512 length:705 start_codon:yes stop_codon:yes gene_type:complete
MENQPKKRGRKAGSKKNPTENKEPPKKRGRKPKKKIVTNENPVFADDNLNMEDLIIKLNNDKNDQENNLSFTIDEHEEINYNKKSKLCWNCSHDFFDRIHGVPINYNSGVFHTVGDFCSVECMSRYAVDNMSDDIYNILPLINLYNNKINNNNNKVKLAPNRLLLDIYGGDMTINDYRNNNILYDLKLPIIIPTNYNINKYNLKNNNNLTDLKLYRKNKPNNNNNNITKKLNID